ncbi:MAG: AAA family ATPase [Candidatus Helarchaeota archaeon]
MHIDSIKVKNYRCISKLNLEKLSPITVFVGRNNTGKSAILEAIALASSADDGWFDNFNFDIIDSIVRKRGGWNYTNLLIKVGQESAEIEISGKSLKGNLIITQNKEKIPEDVDSFIYSEFHRYLEQNYSKHYNRMKKYLQKFSLEQRKECLKIYDDYFFWLKNNMGQLNTFNFILDQIHHDVETQVVPIQT